ncbi:hypothetical protein DFA_06704 [Cavenderia fasciculata]|uniref:Uncharacterized protein n=1 Tax=Cavenderia fasciculata TaxID=261658 RepID=F4Q217_CACFS|nr:uncharacterized protein DFA_06704 [Cavenderia fasciculata]EGG18037.1 hypothetical protein DFA_06704 [Cavenderia fasciculata]|eukprot:XP_004356930.1 hypothetical protein DFA_06704 [Cavenderia fasciculata]
MKYIFILISSLLLLATEVCLGQNVVNFRWSVDCSQHCDFQDPDNWVGGDAPGTGDIATIDLTEYKYNSALIQLSSDIINIEYINITGAPENCHFIFQINNNAQVIANHFLATGNVAVIMDSYANVIVQSTFMIDDSRLLVNTNAVLNMTTFTSSLTCSTIIGQGSILSVIDSASIGGTLESIDTSHINFQGKIVFADSANVTVSGSIKFGDDQVIFLNGSTSIFSQGLESSGQLLLDYSYVTVYGSFIANHVNLTGDSTLDIVRSSYSRSVQTQIASIVSEDLSVFSVENHDLATIQQFDLKGYALFINTTLSLVDGVANTIVFEEPVNDITITNCLIYSTITHNTTSQFNLVLQGTTELYHVNATNCHMTVNDLIYFIGSNIGLYGQSSSIEILNGSTLVISNSYLTVPIISADGASINIADQTNIIGNVQISSSNLTFGEFKVEGDMLIGAQSNVNVDVETFSTQTWNTPVQIYGSLKFAGNHLTVLPTTTRIVPPISYYILEATNTLSIDTSICTYSNGNGNSTFSLQGTY